MKIRGLAVALTVCFCAGANGQAQAPKSAVQDKKPTAPATLLRVKDAIAQQLRTFPAKRPAGGGLLERQPIVKTPTDELTVPPTSTGRLVVKFHDSAKVRAMADGSVASLANIAAAPDLGACNALLRSHGISFVKAINHPDSVLEDLQARALTYSGRAQPDLAGLMVVEDIPAGEALDVARAINDATCVEFVEFEVPFKAIDPPEGFGSWIQYNGPTVDAANQAFGVGESIVAMLNVPPVPGAGVTVTVPLMSGNDVVTLDLQPHSVRGEGFQMLHMLDDGTLVPVELGATRTVRGSIVGDPGSVVVGSVLENGLYATLRRSNGDRYWIQPLVGAVEDAMPGQHAIYRNEDVLGNLGACGTENPPAAQGPAGPAEPAVPPGEGGVAGPVTCYAEIALDLDSAWVDRFPSIAASGFYAMAVINVVNAQYEGSMTPDDPGPPEALLISHVVTTVIARSPGSDPYAGNPNAITLITDVQNEWNANFPPAMYPRDVAHLLTGMELFGGIIGIARDIGTICTNSTSYSLSQRFGGFACQTDLVAHELGHNWNAVHCECFSAADPALNFTMNPFITCANQFNPQLTVIPMIAYRDSRTCLDCGVPPSGCGVPGNPCSTPSMAPYCSDANCCGAVCAIMPECCDVAWDADCVAIAASVCFECGDAGAGDCYEANYTPGCDDLDCCGLVSGLNPLCAAIWDETCAILANIFCTTGGGGDTPDFEFLQAYKTAEATPGWDIVTSVFPPFSPFGGEGFDIEGLWMLGAELEELGVGVNRARGRGIRIAAIEDAMYPEHEDLDITVEPGQTMWLSEEITSPSHGTAVLGVINAVEQDEPLGVVGIAPDAEGWFFPAFSLEEGARLLTAMTSAANTFSAGDVINFSIGPDNADGGDCNIGILTSAAGPYTLVRLLSDLGVTSVISAGNDCCSLDSTPEAGADSGAIVVSACTPGLPFCRVGFSNHSAEGAAPPHMSAWGYTVATCGYGNLFGPITNPNRWYTTSFSGTSAAAPIVAGMAACIQGLFKQFYGISLAPELLRGNFTFYCQCLICDPQFLPTQEDGLECAGDTLDPEEEEPNIIGGIPLAREWGAQIITEDFFDVPSLVEDIFVARGDLLVGNAFSVRAADGNVATIESQLTLAGDQPQANVPPGSTIGQDVVGTINYNLNGQITDLIVAGRVPNANETDLGVNVTWTGNQDHYLFFEAYDWQAGRFRFVDWSGGVVAANTPSGGAFVLPRSSRFINGGTKQVIVRLWTFAFDASNFGNGSAPGDGPPMRVFWDLIQLINGVEPGEVNPL